MVKYVSTNTKGTHEKKRSVRDFSYDVNAMFLCFYTLLHDTSGVLWYHVDRPCVCLPICLSYHLSVFLFPDNHFSKCQWIFTKLGMGIDIVEIWFGIANGQILTIF